MDFGVPMYLEGPGAGGGFIEFNGFTFTGTGSGFTGTGYSGDFYRLTMVEGLDLPSLRVTQEPKPQAHGAIAFPAWKGARYITLRGELQISQASHATFMANRRAMQANLVKTMQGLLGTSGMLAWAPAGVVGSPTAAEKMRFLYVRAWDFQPITTRDGLIKEFSLGLIAHDPLIRSDSKTTSDASAPFSVSVANNGDTPSPVVVTVVGTATPVTAFTVRQDGTNMLQFTGVSIGASQSLVIDTGYPSISPASYLAGLALTTAQFFTIAPGATDTIDLNAVTGTPLNLQVATCDGWASGV